VATLPWLVPLLGSLAVITCFPKLVLWFPKNGF
jgi:TRAP-type C4-dicarboxylate transport system permease large subunit